MVVCELNDANEIHVNIHGTYPKISSQRRALLAVTYEIGKYL